MRNLVVLFILFMQYPAISQDVVPRDTAYTVVSNGIAYVIRHTDYIDGSYTESKSILGDSSVLLSNYVTQIESRGITIASAAVIAMQASQACAELAKLDTLATALLGISPLTKLMDAYTQEFSNGSWAMIYNNTTVNVSFPVLSTNKRKRLLPQGSTAKTMLVFGPMMRIVSYPASGNNFFFRVKDGYWSNRDKTAILRRL